MVFQWVASWSRATKMKAIWSLGTHWKWEIHLSDLDQNYPHDWMISDWCPFCAQKYPNISVSYVCIDTHINSILSWPLFFFGISINRTMPQKSPSRGSGCGLRAEFFGDCGETPPFGLDDYVIQVLTFWFADDSADFCWGSLSKPKYWYFGGFCQPHHSHES